LCCGVPLLISDRTPWQDLENHAAGWSLPLDTPQAFAAVIDSVAMMPDERRARLSAGARALAERYIASSDAAAAARRMFETVLLGHVSNSAVGPHHLMAAE